MLRSLRRSCQIAAALGILSISLTGEMAAGWIIAGGGAWTLGFFVDRDPARQFHLRRFETIAMAVMLGFMVFDFFVLRYTFFVSLAHFLLLFQIVKLIGVKDRKDCFQIFLFSFLQILAACTLSVDAWHAGVLLAMIPTATAALFWSQMTRDCEEARLPEDLSPRRRFRRMAVVICLTALPLNVLLTAAVFIIFPRLTLNASLPGFGNPHAGYTDQVNLARKGRLEQNTALVLWMNFASPRDRGRWDGYLRGEVLSQFDGREWSVSKTMGPRQILPDFHGVFSFETPQFSASMRESVTLADASACTLFVPGKPLRIVAPLPALWESEGRSLRWSVPWRRPLHYEVISTPFSDTRVLSVHLALPAMALDRVAQLARKVAGAGPPLEQAHRIEEYLSKNYRYSTDFGDLVAQNPVDYFLFDRRQGACGHFASAMAVMLRLQKIPSRLVAGYYRGEWNEPAQSIVMREQNAHAWVEAYIPGQGWMSFDPTPVVPLEEGASSTHLLHILRQYGDFFSLQWNRFVIQYDLYSQVRAYERLKGTSGHFGQVLFSWWSKIQFHLNHHRAEQAALADGQTGLGSIVSNKRIFIFLILALATIWLFSRKREIARDEPVRFYRRFLDRMARAGHPKAAHETGWEFARRLARLDPASAGLAHQTTVRYYQVRFRKGPL